MRRTQTPLLLLAVALAVVLVLLWIPTHGGRAERPPGRGGQQGAVAPGLRGSGALGVEGRAGDSDASPSAPKSRQGVLRVRVRSADGALPLKRGVVYLLSKESRNKSGPGAVVALDVDGIASLDGVDPRGHWIGALSEFHLPAFADGDTWEGGDIELVLQGGRLIEVEVRYAEERLPADTWIVAKHPLGRGHEYPAPGERFHFWRSTRIEQPGVEVLRVPTSGTVAVGVRAPGLYAENAVVDVPPGTHHVVFDLRPVCRVRVGVTDAETGQDLANDAVVEVRDLVSQGTVRRVRASLFSQAADWKDEGLPPGEYAVSVRVAGYVPWPATRVRLEHPGEEVALKVPLVLAPTAGRLTLRLDLPDEATLGDEVVHVECRAMGRGSISEEAWSALSVRVVDRQAGSIALWPLAIGEHDLIVWVGSRRVGRVVAQVRGGRTDHARVGLGPGLAVDFSACPLAFGCVEIVAADEKPVEEGDYCVEILGPLGVPLPEVRWESRQHNAASIRERTLTRDRVERRGEVTRRTVLGPFPHAEVRVRDALDKDAAPWVVRRK